MLVMRLARTGRKKLPHYRVVVADSRRAATGSFLKRLGHYDPHTKTFKVDEAATQTYLDNGTQPSSRVVKLLGDHTKVKLPGWAKANLIVKPERPKPAPEEAPAEKIPAESADSAESTEVSASTEEKTPEKDTDTAAVAEETEPADSPPKAEKTT